MILTMNYINQKSNHETTEYQAMKSLKPYLYLLLALSMAAVQACGPSKSSPRYVDDTNSDEAVDWENVSEQTASNAFPAIFIKTSDTTSYPLGIEKANVDVKVVGNIATTTMEITFFNNLDRILTGELYFPLGQGQTVSRFAMDVNGNMREGVVVEKAKGRIAFERTSRQRIDPGLLEWTQGNNFKSRVYPIPANGSKTILVAFEQELDYVGKQKVYTLPLNFETPLKEFDIRAEVFMQSIKPEMAPNGLANFEFSKWNQNYVAEKHLENVALTQPIAFNIPSTNSATVIIEEAANGERYFYAHISPKKQILEKKLPESIAVFWDVSLSGANRQLKKESDLLKAYLSNFSQVNLQFTTFSNEVHEEKSFDVKNDDISELLNFIDHLDYDGGTQAGVLNFSSVTADEILVFSDGLGNFGNEQFQNSEKPVYTVNSSQSANHSALRFLAMQSGGSYINLMKVESTAAVKMLSQAVYSFLGVPKSYDVSKVYPSIPTPVHDHIGIAGTLTEGVTEIKLNFGFAGEVSHTETIKLTAEPSSSGMVERIWAQKRLEELDLEYDEYKNVIQDLGKKFGIVTRNTSLIVLDRVEDYVEHEIVPPAELKEQYYALVGRQQKDEKRAHEKHIKEVETQFAEYKVWWNKTYKIPKRIKRKKNIGLDADSVRMNFGDQVSEEVAADADEGSQADREYRQEEEQIAEQEPSANRPPPPPEMEIVEDDAVLYNWHDVSANATTQRANNGYTSSGTYTVRVTDVQGSTFGNEIVEKSQGRKADISIEGWTPDANYIRELEKNKDDLYKHYLILRKEHQKTPSFYMDVADMLMKLGKMPEAIRVLSNLAELELENPALLRILAHRLEQLKSLELAILTYEKVKDLREEEPQSFRDLGLAYAANGEYQMAVNTLYHVVENDWNDRFPNIEALVAYEMNSVISNCGEELELGHINENFLYEMPTDLRVVLNWDTDACDMDLWVTDPLGEKCLYSHNRTQTGGRMSNDFTGGYGPEEFIIKKAVPGEYKIQVNYFGTRQQTVLGPTTIQVQLISNYGRKEQTIQDVTRRLGEAKEQIDIGSFEFKEENQ